MKRLLFLDNGKIIERAVRTPYGPLKRGHPWALRQSVFGATAVSVAFRDRQEALRLI
jgi:hypothetical protein